MDYTELPGFSDVLLEESWVLRIDDRPDYLSFEMEFVLTPENPRYTDPVPGITFSTAIGEFTFSEITNRVWVERTEVAIYGPDGEVDFGNIDAMTVEGDVYTLVGEWGEVKVQTALPPRLTYR